MMTQRIGFVDFRLDNFHAKTYLARIRNDLKARGYDVAGCWAMDADDGKAPSNATRFPHA